MDFHFQKGSELPITKALSSEWLETNGLGSYASSTILNCNTRKYHGLLVSNLPEFSNKFVLLSQLADTFFQDSDEYFLTPRQYAETVQASIFPCYKTFTLDTHPHMIYQLGDTILTKELLMIDREDTILVKYKVIKGNNAKITIQPLIACRNFHELSKLNDYIQQESEDCMRGKKIKPYYDMPDLFFQVSTDFEFLPQATWYQNIEYEVEKKRGFDYIEDLFSPGTFTIPLKKNQEVILSCSTLEHKALLSTKWKKEIQRRDDLIKKLKGSVFQKQLKKACRSFMQKNPKNNDLSIVAGYPWFSVWGRDTMVALPGCTLYSDMEKECLAVLKTFCEHENNGLLPNILGGTKETHAYNSVDTSLWFAWAVQQYYLKTKDIKSIVKHFWVTLNNIFTHYKNGTFFNIKMEENGLLSAGSKETNLTWMDVIIDHTPVTPRYGFAVEVNALWYNMICFMHTLAKKLSDPLETELKSLMQLITKSFRSIFWDQNLGYLKDCVNQDFQDMAIRPNQILAVSLPYSPLTNNISVQVIKTVKEHLLTSFGLRTLSPNDPSYFGHYQQDNDLQNRERAYHNGTAWPWLLGHFGEALLKITKNKKEDKKILDNCIKALQSHLADAGIGYISEIFDGDSPHHPGGCINQAWSTGEILRLTYLLKSV
jgi:predicted glycogen debranching enzyme